MASIDEILAGLGSEELEELKNALFKQMSEAVNDAPGQMLLYNRSPDEFEFQWDSKPYCIPGHKYVQLPLGIARMAVLKSRYSGIGTSEVESWVVPRGAEGFGVPMKTNGLTGDPIKDYPIPLRATEAESPLLPGEQEVFELAPIKDNSIKRPVHRTSAINTSVVNVVAGKGE